MSRTRLEWAQWMIAKGICAFVVNTAAKEPLGGVSWYARNTTEPDILAKWFEATPDCNYGLWLGEEHVVIDLDTKPGVNGVFQFDKICKENGINNWLFEIETLMIETPSGGYHLYFKAPFPCSNSNTFEKGIDVRGDEGYVVGPGCATDEKSKGCVTGEYSVLDPGAEIADLPEFLVPFMKKTGIKDPNRDVSLVEYDLPLNVEAGAVYMLTAPPAIQDHGGDDHTYATACNLRDKGVSEEQAFLLMTDESKGPSWNQRCDPPWDDGHLRVKLRNSYRFAQNQPGCDAPSLSADNVHGSWPEGGFGLTPEKIAEHFDPEVGLSLVGGTDYDDPEVPSDVPLHDSQSTDDPDDDTTELDGKEKKELWIGYQDFMAQEKVREYVIEGWLIAHGITALLAKRGTGKSTVALDIGCHLALDMPWQDIAVMEGWKVIYICGEDEEGMILNARAWHKWYGKSPSNDRFRFASEIIKMTKRSVLRAKVKEIREWAGKDARCIIILDTWARATSGWTANAQEDMDLAFKNAEDLAKALNGPMIACFHPPKNAKELTIRGSAVQEDDTSGIWYLEESGGGIKLTIGRAKGKGKGAYRQYEFKEVDLGQMDYFGKPLQGIVPIVTGGVADGGSEEISEERTKLKVAWALAVIGVEKFSMDTSNDYTIKQEGDLCKAHVGDFIEMIYEDREDGGKGEEFFRNYLYKLEALNVSTLGTKSKNIQVQLTKVLTADRTTVNLEHGESVSITGADDHPIFVVNLKKEES